MSLDKAQQSRAAARLRAPHKTSTPAWDGAAAPVSQPAGAGTCSAGILPAGAGQGQPRSAGILPAGAGQGQPRSAGILPAGVGQGQPRSAGILPAGAGPTPVVLGTLRRATSRASFMLALLLGACLALQSCDGLSVESGHFRPVSSTGSAASGTPLAVNQDGRFQGHIAFIRNHQLYILDGKTGNTRILPAGANVQDPAYSPNGSRLAYISRGAAWSDVMVIPASGGAPGALTHNQGTGQQITCPNGISESDGVWAAGPIWAADGASLYYLSDQQKLSMACGFVDLAVWQIAAQGGAPHLVLWPARGKDTTGLPGAGGDANLALRPGTPDELAYTHYAYDPQQSDSQLIQLFVAALSTQQETPLSPAAVDTTPEQALEPAWSPDGQYLAYIRRNGDSNDLSVIHVSSPASGAPHYADYATAAKLLSLSGPIAYPIWSPDGKSLLYLAFKDNEYNLYLAQLSFNGASISLQGSTIQLTQGGVDGDSRPTWTGA